MIKATSFSSAARTRRVLVWVSIFWFISTADSQSLELITVPQVAARCGENVSLTCDLVSSRQLDIKLFSWMSREETVCRYQHDQTDGESRCDSTNGTSHHRLTLTLYNIMPANAGTYLCKLRSNVGTRLDKTVVTVQECPGRSDPSMNESHAECLFSGVYPRGVVHWFQGGVNLTDSASTQEEEAQRGLYNVWSTIEVKKGNLSRPYTCSLWVPSLGKYFSSGLHLQPPPARGVGSSGSVVKLQGICIVVQIIGMIQILI